MSSTNPAFVKAFARRNRAASQSPTRPHASIASASEITEPEVSGPEVSGPDVSGPDVSESDVSFVEGDTPQPQEQSVADRAGVWLDTVQPQFARADQPTTAPPIPHVNLPSEPAPPHTRTVEESLAADMQTQVKENSIDEPVITDSLQHIHTAYATAPADLAFYRLDTTQTPEIESPPVTDLDVEPVVQNFETESAADIQTERVATPQSVDPEVVTTTRIDPTHGSESRPIDPSVEHEQLAPLVPFRPVWEVDVFDIPKIVADLFFEGALFQQIAERMGEAVNRGLNSVLVTSAQTGEGRSSVAIGIAMAAAAAGIRVALVDADTKNPSLADDLRLELQYGWVDTIRAGLPIAEVAVHAVEDGVTLVPLMPPGGATAATGAEVVQLLEEMRNRFELVVIDGPAESLDDVQHYASVVDSAIIVQDVTRSDPARINEYSCRLREQGITGVGVVENFA
ncbi:MAG: division plane positioning ATPase MipZ [Rubripirellula sp.]|nr:division plane positioning ATPase MipZ [Rubripirellula sp.]